MSRWRGLREDQLIGEKLVAQINEFLVDRRCRAAAGKDRTAERCVNPTNRPSAPFPSMTAHGVGGCSQAYYAGG